MLNGLLGKKLGMTQIFKEDGTVVPVTVLEAGPCTVIQKKTVETDGYTAVQLGFVEKGKKGINKPSKGHFDKAKQKPVRFLREFRLDKVDDIQVGQTVDVDIFKPGEKIDVSGVTKGRGFAGVMKRHGFAGFPASRGTHEYFRHSGSISGGRTIRSRIFLGKKMPGHMGCDNVTMFNLEVVKTEKEKNLLFIKGATPGANGGILFIRKR